MISYNSACLLTSLGARDALTQTLCLHCGLLPISLQSDGNAKNSLFLNRGCHNLVLDKSDTSDMISLEEFLKKCVINLTGSALFQNFEKLKINLLKIPPFVANMLLGKPMNRECLKKSIFLKEMDLTSIDFTELSRIVTSGKPSKKSGLFCIPDNHILLCYSPHLRNLH